MVPFLLRSGTEKKTPYPESLYLSDIEPEHCHGMEWEDDQYLSSSSDE